MSGWTYLTGGKMLLGEEMATGFEPSALGKSLEYLKSEFES